jgi:hypothetical protein
MKHVHTFESFLNEKFGDDYAKNKYIELPSSTASQYADDIIDLINNAYKDKGGNIKMSTSNDVKNGDVTYWLLKDLDSDPDVDTVIGGYFTPKGLKMTVMGQDGSREAKRDVSQKMIDLMKTRGFYAEMDKDLAQKFGLPHMQDEKKVRAVLQKDLEWNNDGSYVRTIAGGKHEKVLVGIPK